MYVPVCHGSLLPPSRSTLPPGWPPGLSLEAFQGGLGGLVCRHVLCERRSRTRQELMPGLWPPQAALVSAVIGAGEHCGPYPKFSGHVAGRWLQKKATKNGSQTD